MTVEPEHANAPRDGLPAGSPKSTATDVGTSPFVESSAQAKHRYGRFNLAIVGGTGVGKSSLVNAVFGRDLARVGKGLPVTSGIHYYHDDSLGVWDFEGFEIGSERSPAETLRAHLASIAEGPADRQISVVWYCVLSHADRLTGPDIEMIRELDAAGLPVILVLTKVDWAKHPVTGKYRAPKDVEEFRDWLEHPVDSDGRPLHLPIRRVILTAAQHAHGKGAGHGLGELVEQTLALSPKNEQDAFRIAQRLNLPWKRDLARPVIVQSAAAAAAAAAVPIPIADAATLAPIQLAMMGRISAIYDLEFKTMLSATALAQLGAQLSGQALARSLVKVVPFVGSVVNAGVASAVTAAVGEGWMRLCEQVHTGKVKAAQIDEAWGDFAPSVANIVAKLTSQRRGPKG